MTNVIQEYMQHMAFYIKQAGEVAKLYENSPEMADKIHAREFTDRIWEVWEMLEKR